VAAAGRNGQDGGEGLNFDWRVVHCLREGTQLTLHARTPRVNVAGRWGGGGSEKEGGGEEVLVMAKVEWSPQEMKRMSFGSARVESI
jgi:hypothetical protein